MSVIPAIRIFTVDKLRVEILPTYDELGRVSAAAVANCLQQALAKRGQARLVVGTGPSQGSYVASLLRDFFRALRP